MKCLSVRKKVTVQLDDWLSKLAEKYFGNSLAYPLIIDATNSQPDSSFAKIENPDLIEPGWKLCIPDVGDETALLNSSTTSTSPSLISANTAIELATPELISPLANEVLGEYPTFVWSWDGPPLPENQTFEIRVWKDGEPHYGAYDARETVKEV